MLPVVSVAAGQSVTFNFTWPSHTVHRSYGIQVYEWTGSWTVISSATVGYSVAAAGTTGTVVKVVDFPITSNPIRVQGWYNATSTSAPNAVKGSTNISSSSVNNLLDGSDPPIQWDRTDTSTGNIGSGIFTYGPSVTKHNVDFQLTNDSLLARTYEITIDEDTVGEWTFTETLEPGEVRDVTVEAANSFTYDVSYKEIDVVDGVVTETDVPVSFGNSTSTSGSPTPGHSSSTVSSNIYDNNETESFGEQDDPDTSDGSRVTDGSTEIAAIQSLDTNDNTRNQELRDLLVELDNREALRDRLQLQSDRENNEELIRSLGEGLDDFDSSTAFSTNGLAGYHSLTNSNGALIWTNGLPVPVIPAADPGNFDITFSNVPEFGTLSFEWDTPEVSPWVAMLRGTLEIFFLVLLAIKMWALTSKMLGM